MRAFPLALLILVAAPTCAAQVSVGPDVALSLSAGEVRLAPEATQEIQATVTNAGPLPGTVTLAAADLGGWRADMEPNGSFRLDAGQSATVTILLAAPKARDGASERQPVFTAQLNDDAGRSASAQAQLLAVRIDPPLPVVTPWYRTTAALLVGLATLLVLALAAAGALALAARRRHQAFLERETGIAIEMADGPVPFGPSRDVVYRVAVRNVSARPRVAVISAAQVPPGWRATPALPRMPLSPGERALVTFLVSPPPDAPARAPARLVLEARPEEATKLSEKLALDIPTPDVRIPVAGERAKVPLRPR